MEFNIIHTNDIHSNYENFSKIVSKIKEIKDKNTIILEAGDFADFKRLELQGTKGEAAIELLEYASYDAITVGNNETFNGKEILTNMATKSKIPFLTCNLHNQGDTNIDGVKSSIILDKNGFKILVVGASPDLREFYELDNLIYKDYLEAIEKEILLNKNKYDICIVLSHLGMDADRIIAEKTDGVNVIIGGHYHILMEKPEIINNTIIHTSGCYGENVGFLRIEIINGAVKLLESSNINIEDVESDGDIIKILKENKEKAIDNLSNHLYNIDADLWHDVIEENPITNLLADALFDVLRCDLAIINSGVINGGIRKGSVTNKKLLEICPSPLNPTVFQIQGKYIKEALQNSLDSDFCLKDGRGPGFRGKYLGRLHVSNAIIECDGRKISKININGEAFIEDKWYTVGSSDYLYRGTGYSSLKNNRDENYNKEYLRDTLREYLDKKDYIKKAYCYRWVIK